MLVAVAFMVALGFGVVAPAITPFAVQFGVSKAAAGAVISAFAFARLATAPFAGRLVNRFGERVLLGIGIGIVAVSSLLAGLAQSYWQLLALRGAGGFGSIMFSVSSASLLYRVTAPHHARTGAKRLRRRIPARVHRRAGARRVGRDLAARCRSSCTPAPCRVAGTWACARCGTARWPRRARETTPWCRCG